MVVEEVVEGGKEQILINKNTTKHITRTISLVVVIHALRRSHQHQHQNIKTHYMHDFAVSSSSVYSKTWIRVTYLARLHFNLFILRRVNFLWIFIAMGFRRRCDHNNCGLDSNLLASFWVILINLSSEEMLRKSVMLVENCGEITTKNPSIGS